MANSNTECEDVTYHLSQDGPLGREGGRNVTVQQQDEGEREGGEDRQREGEVQDK